MNAVETLLLIIRNCEECLKKLEAMDDSEFVVGKRHAYVECLEIIQNWAEAKLVGLDYDIEKRYPLT